MTIKPVLAFLLLILLSLPVAGQDKIDGVSSESGMINDLHKSKPDTNLVRLQLKLGEYYLHKQKHYKANQDTALNFIDNALRLSSKLRAASLKNEALQLMGAWFMEKGDLKNGRIWFMQAVDYYRKTGDKYNEALTWKRLAVSVPDNNADFIPYKIQCYEQARTLLTATYHALEAVDTYRDIAEAHLHQKNLNLAQKELLQVLDQYKSLNYKKLYYTYFLLAEVSKLKIDMHQELFYRLEVVKSMEATGDVAQADFYYAKLALVYADLDMYDQSLTYILKSLQVLKKRKQYDDFYGDLSLAVYDFLKVGRPQDALIFLKKTIREVPPGNLAQQVDLSEAFGSCYVAMKQYGQAEKYYLEMMRVYHITNFNKEYYTTNDQMVTDFIHYYETMGGFYLLTNQYQKASRYLTKILELPKSVVRPITLTKIHQMQFRVDSASGNYISAIKHLEIHKMLNDSLFNATKSQQIAELEINYQTKQKEQSIKLLKSESVSQRAELQKVNLEKNITIGGIAMLLLFVGLAYRGYRHKQQSNMQLQVKQTEINQQNLSLQNLLNDKDGLLEEKDWLLKEVHHRVKNNLQIVMSLLNTQSAFLKNNAALAAIRESQNRVQAIALIHQKLYSSSNVAFIDMAVYIDELVRYLGDCYNATERGIRFNQAVESIKLDVAQAVPVGLILNEAITNSIKYAFDVKRGEIFISLKQKDNDKILLAITDNGKGFPADLDIEHSSSLGMEMMKALSKQLGGFFYVESNQGVIVTVEFKTEKVFNSIEAEPVYS